MGRDDRPPAGVELVGPLETDPRFPDRTNVQIASVDRPGEVTARVWERGVGETAASGTSAVAVAAATHGDGEVLVRVRDDGPGLDERDLERIFDPFERSRGSAGRGSGLGLAIARGFAQANGCRLWAESPPGAGAVFVLAMPRVDVPAAVTA